MPIRHNADLIAREDQHAVRVEAGAGEMCIRDRINRVQWNEKTKTDEVTDVLYRSESGEPVLLFANLDGIAYEADTQVFITDNNGNRCV